MEGKPSAGKVAEIHFQIPGSGIIRRCPADRVGKRAIVVEDLFNSAGKRKKREVPGSGKGEARKALRRKFAGGRLVCSE